MLRRVPLIVCGLPAVAAAGWVFLHLFEPFRAAVLRGHMSWVAAVSLSAPAALVWGGAVGLACYAALAVGRAAWDKFWGWPPADPP